jgi:hypothetical protein
MNEINEKWFLYSGWPVSYKNTYSRTFSINFSVNSSAIPHCPPSKSVSKTQMSAARRDLEWSAASARLLFDGDDAILHNSSNTFPPRAQMITARRGSLLFVWPNPNLGSPMTLTRIVLRKSVRARNGETFAILPVSRYQYISSCYSLGNFSHINEVQFAIFGTVVRFLSTRKTCRIGGNSEIRIK